MLASLTSESGNFFFFFLLFEKSGSVWRWETKYFMGMALANTAFGLPVPKEVFPQSQSKLCDVNERLDGLPSREPLLSDNKHVTQF